MIHPQEMKNIWDINLLSFHFVPHCGLPMQIYALRSRLLINTDLYFTEIVLLLDIQCISTYYMNFQVNLIS